MTETIVDPSKLKPVAGVLTDLYTVPALTKAMGATLVACNQVIAPDTIRYAVSPGGGAINAADYEWYDLPLQGFSTQRVTHGFPLAAGTKVRVYSLNGTTSFAFYKVEVTP